MPNWCFTNITIAHDNSEELEEFYNKIEEWTSHDYCDNGFGKNWLGNIVGNSGIGTIDEDKESDLRCRGSLIDVDLTDNQLTIQTETAWVPMLQMWVKLLEKYLPEAELVYSTEELGCEILCTNDPVYIGKYYIDAWDMDDIETDDMVNECDVIEILQELLNAKEDNIEEFLKMFDESEYSEHMQIHKWEYVEVENWD